ncbi:superoxide reductase [Anaerosphaera aminiphila DSM 21120]|uniref:Superoxide reductase n=1 Tax=Anaerosphaera aminiphila DSM 21120 TaxID=1120995 RepID=A0A1M5R978_9FIRM|nr:class II SORL domain-containing protein [Anaerosphaera aminiphila]SHH22791.1 superoxide reductase [Anaerosphaera aminiphila DSM 21120]
MKKITETVQAGDWKNEKHVPVIHAENAGEELVIKAMVGEEIEHPNTLEHHIGWIKLFFQPEGAKFPIEVGSFDFKAHGEEELFTKPEVEAHIKTNKKGTVYAISYCNIHGLWENSLEI